MKTRSSIGLVPRPVDSIKTKKLQEAAIKRLIDKGDYNKEHKAPTRLVHEKPTQ